MCYLIASFHVLWSPFSRLKLLYINELQRNELLIIYIGKI